jgi:hypothetical protein
MKAFPFAPLIEQRHIYTLLQKRFFLNLIFECVNIDDDAFLETNTMLTKAVQNSIIKTNKYILVNKDSFCKL